MDELRKSLLSLEQIDLHPDDLGSPKVELKVGFQGHGEITHIQIVQKMLWVRLVEAINEASDHIGTTRPKVGVEKLWLDGLEFFCKGLTIQMGLSPIVWKYLDGLLEKGVWETAAERCYPLDQVICLPIRFLINVLIFQILKFKDQLA